jgi:hypothetical protein
MLNGYGAPLQIYEHLEYHEDTGPGKDLTTLIKRLILSHYFYSIDLCLPILIQSIKPFGCRITHHRDSSGFHDALITTIYCNIDRGLIKLLWRQFDRSLT